MRYILVAICLLRFTAGFSQLTKNKPYIFFYGPGDSRLCGNFYVFYDSIGFYHGGCENHFRFISAFRYKVDSNTLECNFIPYSIFPPYSKIVKKKIEGATDNIQVVVYDAFDQMIWPEIAIVKLGKKKDLIIKRLTSFRDTLAVEKSDRKKIFWTLKDYTRYSLQKCILSLNLTIIFTRYT